MRIKATKAGQSRASWDEMIKKIESYTETRKMITFEEAKQAGLKSTTDSEVKDHK